MALKSWRLEDDPPNWFDGTKQDAKTVRALAQKLKSPLECFYMPEDGSLNFDGYLYVIRKEEESLAKAMLRTLTEELGRQNEKEKRDIAERAKHQPHDFPGGSKSETPPKA